MAMTRKFLNFSKRKEARKKKKALELAKKQVYDEHVTLQKQRLAAEDVNPPLDKDVIISLQNANKFYLPSYEQAVKDFSLDIKQGEFIVLVGPSGCGKSTTLRMIAGLEDITSGDLFVKGQFANFLPPEQRDMAMVFQSYALYPHLTVYENMAYSLKLRKYDKDVIYEKVKEAASILQLGPYLTRKPKELSGGQRQRVALGRAIVRSAEIFLMDEPLSNLDAKLRVVMRSEIVALHNKLKTTTIYVTHDQVEAMSMATRLVVMDKGEIQQIGTPQEIYFSPVNLFTATFVGTPPMNVINCDVINGRINIGNYEYKLTSDELDAIKTFYEQYKQKLSSKLEKFEQILNNNDENDEDTSRLKDNILIIEERDKILDNISALEDFITNDYPSIIVGIRPDEFILSEDEDALEVTLTNAEMMGKDYYIYFDLNKDSLIAKIDSEKPLKVGDVLTLSIPRKSMYFFDPLSEKRFIFHLKNN